MSARIRRVLRSPHPATPTFDCPRPPFFRRHYGSQGIEKSVAKCEQVRRVTRRNALSRKRLDMLHKSLKRLVRS
jgi:hypothetical protein